MEHWDEVRTAFHVARLGTVSAAAEVMGVHHATVIRHIDALEKGLGVRLFQRHARGYTPTEAGRDLLATAQRTDEQFRLLSSRIKGLGETVTGEIVVTSVAGLDRNLIPAFAAAQEKHAGLIIHFLTDLRLFRLDAGEAHLAIRAGAQPQEPEYVVQPLSNLAWGMYASTAYVRKHGKPTSTADLANHRLLGSVGELARAPAYRWLAENVPAKSITFRSTDSLTNETAIRAGMGIGFLLRTAMRGDPDLVEVLPPSPSWTGALWLVTHMDLHRTPKVQAVIAALKQAAKGWTNE